MATEVFDFDGAGERYKFLLQPVKDLATNWDLDIANTLEEYIQRVVDENDSAVLVDRNGRRKVFNFAEAALLIHGTTTVYVRKVEYVHQIALNFFDQLKEDVMQEKGQRKRRKGDAGPEEEGGEAGDEGGENPEDLDEPARRREKQKPKVSLAAMRALLEKLTLRRPATLPTVPIAFIPLSDFEKTDVPLFTRTNGAEQIGKKDDFRINSCHIYQSVALLDIKHIALVDRFAPVQRPSQPEAAGRSTGHGFLEPLMERSIEEDMDADLNLTDRTLLEGENGAGVQLEHDGGHGMDVEDSGGGGGDLDFMDDDGGAGDGDVTITGAGENADGQMDQQQQENDENNDDNAIVDGSSALGEEFGRAAQSSLAQHTTNHLTGLVDTLQASTFLSHSRPLTGLNLRNTSERSASTLAAAEPPRDWQELLEDFLDPLDAVREQSKAYRKKTGCVQNVAKQIRAREARIQRECRARGVPNERSIKSYIDSQMFRRPLKKRAFAFGQFNSFLMDQAVLALNPLIYEEEKRKTELQKRRRKELQAAERAERVRQRSSQRSSLVDPVLDHPNDDDEDLEQGQNHQQLEMNQQEFGADNGEEEEEGYDDDLMPNMGLDDMDEEDNTTVGGDANNLAELLEVDELQNSLGGIQNMYTGFQHLISSKRRDKNALASRLAQANHLRNVYDETVQCWEGLDGGEFFNPDDLLRHPERPPSQMDYDEIIAFHLRKYWAASEAAMSKFGERIQLWEARMAVALEEEQRHREFNTRVYGDELLEQFGGGVVGTEIDFTQMLTNVPNAFDRSRYLLVALILANMGNIQIGGVDMNMEEEETEQPQSSSGQGRQKRQQQQQKQQNVADLSLEMGQGDGGPEADRIMLKLLKLERHHQVFEEEQRLLAGAPVP